jgi:predicted metalloprotease
MASLTHLRLWRKLALAVGLAFLGLILVACGGSTGTSTANFSDDATRETADSNYSATADGSETTTYGQAAETTLESATSAQYEAESEATTVAAENQYVLEELPEATPAPATATPPALTGPEGKPLEDFLFEVGYELDAKWSQWFANAGYSYSSANLQIYQEEQLSIGGCGGIIQNYQGPLYCSETQTIYYPYPWEVRDTGKSLEEFGDFAVAATLAHEIGHHVQGLLGLVSNQNVYSIQMELQADCFAGVWASSVYHEGRLEPGDIEEAIYLLMNIADLPGTPWDDPQAHGTEQQRIDAFSHGYQTGDPDQCWSG